MEDVISLSSGRVILGSSAPNTPNHQPHRNQPSSDNQPPSSPTDHTIRGSQQQLNYNNNSFHLEVPLGLRQSNLSNPVHSAPPHRHLNKNTKRPSDAPMEPPIAKFLVRQKEPHSIKEYIDRVMSDLASVISTVQQPEYRNSYIQVLSQLEQINSGHPNITATNIIVNAANNMEQIIAKASRHFSNSEKPSTRGSGGSPTPPCSDSSNGGVPTDITPRTLFSEHLNDTSLHGKRVTIIDPKPSKKQQLQEKKQKKRDHTVILIKHSLTSFTDINPFELRTKINQEIAKKQNTLSPVIGTITKSIAQNLILTTTDKYSADFLIEQRDILARFIQFKEAKKDISFFKVAVHGVTLQLDTPEMPQMIRDEINTFNKPLNLTVVGTPYWLTSESRRLGTQKAASMVIAFATEEEQTRAIRNRLNIGGISVRVEKLHSVLPSTQCTKCCGFGHLQQRCPKTQPNCAFCAAKHHTREHSCTACNIIGSPCEHTIYKCCNCNELHTAYSKECSTRPTC